MKILEINIFNYRKGGSEAVYFNTIKLLKENGHEVEQFALKHSQNLPNRYDVFFPESQETRRGVLAPLKNLVYYFYNFEVKRNINKLLKEIKPDIAQIHLMWGGFSISLIKTLKKHNIPVVLTIHEYRLVCPAYTFRNGKGHVCEKCSFHSYYHCLINKCCKNSYFLSAIMTTEMYYRNNYNVPSYVDGLVYVSKFAKGITEKYMPELKNKENIVLYNTSDSIINNYCLPNSRYYLFYGRLSQEKGIETLIKAFSLCPNEKLLIVGTGPIEEQLKKMSANKTNIEFLGYKVGDQLKEIVKNAYFVIVPSEWYENNPMTIVESYSLAVPVIGSNIGGIPEIIDNGNTGFLFESKDYEGLARIIKECSKMTVESYTTFKERALSFAESFFNNKKYYDQLISFFYKIKQQ